jgi:hypothetical protein
MARTPGTFACAALVLAALSATSAAHADPTAADRETARTLMDQGRDLRDKGDLKEALKRFQAANDIMHVPTTALEVAKSQVALGLLVEARDTVAALRQIPAKRESQLFRDARVKAEALDASLGGRVPQLTITLKGAPPGQEAELTVDGVSVPQGVVGLPRSVDPGHHVITAKTATAEGKLEIDVREGDHKPVEVELISTAPPPPPVVAETPEPQPVGPPRKSHSPTVVTFIGIGVAGAGAIAGAVTGILSISKKSTLETECPTHMCFGSGPDSTLSSATTLATLSDITFGVAGAGAVVAVVSLIVGHPGKEEPPAQSSEPSTGLTMTPWFAGNAAGIRGSF